MSEDIMLRFQPLLDRCISYSIKFEDMKPDLHIRSLEEVDRAATKIFGRSHSGSRTWLEVLLQLPTSPKHTSPMHWSTLLAEPNSIPLNSFFEYAFQYPIHPFINHELKTGRNANCLVAGQPLLYAAALSADLRLIEILFNHGADLNFCGGGIKPLTPWIHVLSLIQYQNQLHSDSGPPPIILARLDMKADIVSIFLDHNADPQAIVSNRSVEDSIKRAFLFWNREQTEELLRKLPVLKKAFKEPEKLLSGMKTFFKKLRRHGSKAT